MRTFHSQKQRWFSNSDEPDAVMNDNQLTSKSLCGVLANSLQLMLSHFAVRFIVNSCNLTSSFEPPNHAPKIDYRTRGKRSLCWSREGVGCNLEAIFGYQDFTNVICHSLKALVQWLAALSAHKRRYQNDNESM
jgi:hypothetical protein